MYGLLGFLAVSMMILTGTQSASIGDGPLGMNFFKLAKWWMDKNGATQLQPPRKLQHQPTAITPHSSSVLPRPTMFTTVTVQRYTYVELKCPIEGSPVVWTVTSGQTDGIHAGKMLIFPRMAGDVEQQYQCRVSDATATLHVQVIADIPHDKTDAVSDICEHGKVCPISCGAAAEWDGVALVKERWTPLQWPTSKQVICTGYSQDIYVVVCFHYYNMFIVIIIIILLFVCSDRLTRPSSAMDSCSRIYSLHLLAWRATTCIPSQRRALLNLVSPSARN